MPEFPATPIDEVKRRLIAGMVEFMEGDDEEPDDAFDCGYTRNDIERCSSIIDAYLANLTEKRGEAEPEIIDAVKRVVIELNELNADCGGGLIETEQREDLCHIILVAAQKSGLTTSQDVTEEWREW